MVIYFGSKKEYAPVAQLDRVFGYEPKGRGFESLPACQIESELCSGSIFFIYKKRGRDSNPERVDAKKKTVRRTVFRGKVRAQRREGGEFCGKSAGLSCPLCFTLLCLVQF